MTKEEEWLPEDNVVMKAIALLDDNFPGGADKTISVDIFFGVKELSDEIEDYTFWDSSLIGEAVFDPKFDMSKETS